MIGFLQPLWLWALPAALLPLILHLVARRQPPTVPFPAVRYLQQVTRDHQRRLRLQHWLLLLVRTLLILALVLAAAGPTVARQGLPGHAPAALVLVLDNSPSSGAVTGGVPALDRLRAAALEVLGKATGEDAIWLLTADGGVRRAPVEALRRTVDSLAPSEFRLDLGAALSRAADLLAQEDRPAEIIVLSDLQRTALGAATVKSPLLVARPAGSPPANVGVIAIHPGEQPWAPGEHRVRVRLEGDSGRATPLILRLGERDSRPRLAGVDALTEVPLQAPVPGWHPLAATIDPDEFRADDRRVTMVRVLPVARARWDSTDRYLDAAATALVEAGRLRPGDEVTLGSLGAGASVVVPPNDVAALGALNRALERRGSAWRFGGPVAVEQAADSNALVGTARVYRRFRLLYTGGAPEGVVATVAGEPWIAGTAGIVLVGSRFDPAWTDLPASPRFVPLVDALANRLVRGEQDRLDGTPGAPVRLPDAVDEVEAGGRRWDVEGGAAWRPPATGLYLLRTGADTIGALAVNLDPRESDLRAATDAEVTALWPTARMIPLGDVTSAAFAAGAQGHLRGPLLVLAALLALVEMALASGRWRRA